MATQEGRFSDTAPNQSRLSKSLLTFHCIKKCWKPASEPVILSDRQRELVSDSIEEVCAFRGYDLRALNVRTNHAHVVVSKSVKPEKILNDLKAYATRKLRGEKAVASDQKVWSRHGSTRYLWKPKQVQSAIEYVLYGQGDLPFEPNKV
ncbi:MAG TPA: transposase [Pyrinomonadaceae bacterium]|nr:transposase [Pyrinomonadaceae bacterium]